MLFVMADIETGVAKDAEHDVKIPVRLSDTKTAEIVGAALRKWAKRHAKE